MAIKWLGLAAFVWVVGMFLGSTFEYHTEAAGTWGGSGTGGYVNETPVSTLNYLSNFNNVIRDTTIFGVITLPVPNTEWFKTLGRVMVWNFQFLTGGAMMFYWIFILPITIMLIGTILWSLVAIIQGNAG